MVEIPIWDRRFIANDQYIPWICDFNNGKWLNVYLIPDEIYDKIRGSSNVYDLRLDEIYTLKYDDKTSFRLVSNFHLIGLNEHVQNVNDIKFSSDLHHRIGIVQYMWWWPQPYFSFAMIPDYALWRDKEDFPIMISTIFSHYEPNQFHPFFYDHDKLEEQFNLQLNDIFWCETATLPTETFIEKRIGIIKWSLNEELERLRGLELYKSLILTIEDIDD